MDDPQLLPTALFSPSKAAQQRAAAQDWQRVDVWLSSKFQGRTVPQFERNEDTLRALQALAAANEKADEERDLLWAVQKEALQELRTRKESEDLDPSSPHTSLRQLSTSLDAPGKASLESLASLSITLDAPSPSAESLAATIITATQTSQSLSQHLAHLQNLQRRLETELLSLRQQLQEIRSQDFQPAMSLTRQTLEWTRNTKQLRNKLSEYSDRLAGLQNGSATVAGEGKSGIVEVVEHERRLEELRGEVDLLESSVKAFQGLPKSKDGARREVEKVNRDPDALKRKRDGLFEELVEKG